MQSEGKGREPPTARESFKGVREQDWGGGGERGGDTGRGTRASTRPRPRGRRVPQPGGLRERAGDRSRAWGSRSGLTPREFPHLAGQGRGAQRPRARGRHPWGPPPPPPRFPSRRSRRAAALTCSSVRRISPRSGLDAMALRSGLRT